MIVEKDTVGWRLHAANVRSGVRGPHPDIMISGWKPLGGQRNQFAKLFGTYGVCDDLAEATRKCFWREKSYVKASTPSAELRNRRHSTIDKSGRFWCKKDFTENCRLLFMTGGWAAADACMTKIAAYRQNKSAVFIVRKDLFRQSGDNDTKPVAHTSTSARSPVDSSSFSGTAFSWKVEPSYCIILIIHINEFEEAELIS